MEKLDTKSLQEDIYHETLPNGLEVYLLKKSGFNKKYGIFSTKYGSINNSFENPKTNELVRVPDGIAHFLEHKLFESEQGDVSLEFSEIGSNSNAFTSFNQTSYLFTTTTNVKKNVELLLDFVQTPYFTEESVEKEKGIIAQEIEMYLDNPDWQLFTGLLKNMYNQHPINIDIAGSVESINRITYDMLYECYEIFYHPSNMVLFIGGDIDVQETMHVIKENQVKKNFTKQLPIKTITKGEKNIINQKELEIKQDVAIPKVGVAVKLDTSVLLSGKELLKREIALTIINDYYFGKSSDFYQKLLNDKIINDTFFVEETYADTYAFIILGSDTLYPKEFKNRLIEYILSIQNNNLPKEDFYVIKNKLSGGFLMAMNSIEFIANRFVKNKHLNISMFDIIEIIDEITLKDVLTYRDVFVEDAITSIVIKK